MDPWKPSWFVLSVPPWCALDSLLVQVAAENLHGEAGEVATMGSATW